MTRPATRTYALVAWRADGLQRITTIRLALGRVECLVRAGETGQALEEAIENFWDVAGRVSGIMLGPVRSEEQRWMAGSQTGGVGRWTDWRR